MVIRLGSSLGLSPEVVREFTKTMDIRKSELDQFIEFEQRDLDNFDCISKWYHYATLELMHVKNFRTDVKWIAKRLNISVSETKGAIDRLIRLGYIKVNQDGKWQDLTSGYTTSATNSSQTTVAKKNHQKEIFSKALNAIDEYSIDQRSHSGVTLAVDTKNIDKVRELVKKFRQELLTYLEQSNSEANEVYQLCVAFFPLTNSEQNIKRD